MPEGYGYIVIVALTVAGAYYGGRGAYHHVIQPVDKAVIKVARKLHHKRPEKVVDPVPGYAEATSKPIGQSTPQN